MNAGHFEVGNKSAKGRGRPKGSPNKQTADIKDMIKGALDDLGGKEFLIECANDHRSRTAFLGLVGKILPMQLTGMNGGAIETVSRLIIKGE